MDFSTLIIIVVVISILGGIASILFWGGIAFLGFKAVQNYQKEMDSMMRSYTSTLSNLQNTYGNEVPPEVQQQVYSQFMQAQNKLSQFNDLSRQRHDLFVSDMMGQASSMGMDVSNWN